MSVPDVLPPSPPHTSHRNRITLSHAARPTTSTPNDSPASFAPSSGTGTRKRVEFSPWTNVLDAPLTGLSNDVHGLKSLPKSRDNGSAAKSILKAYTGPLTPADLDDDRPVELVTMDSLVLTLGINDKMTSVDAYTSLAQLIKTYDDLPEDSDTRSNVASVLKYIKRDLVMQEQSFKLPIDTNLVTQALKVAVIFVWSTHIAPLLTDDFKIFITDRAINALIEHTAPKVVIAHYMHLLAMQNFRSILFTSGNRTPRLLDALRDLPNHVQGKGIMAERLLIYQKLIEQAKPVMKAKAPLWLKEVITGLSSPVKDVREKAVSVASRTCAAFPASAVVAQAARDALAEDIKERTLSKMLSQRLERMISTKEESVQVPQIWSLVMLLCNSSDYKIDNWSHTREWLGVIQRCFNCSDIGVRTQALPAWNRFIYVAKPHEANDSLMAMLAKPITAQIERTGTTSSSKGLRPAAISSYCMLLYYAFRPAASHKQYARVWNEYIVKVITTKFLSKSASNADLCCRILMSLFWKDKSASRVWNENRAHENKPMEPEELPALDSRWIRAKSGAILEIFTLLFSYSTWGPSVQRSDQAFVAKAWRHFLRATREASSKEIKPSSDTKQALTGVMTFLTGVVQKNDIYEDDSVPNDATGTAEMASRIAIDELGQVPIVSALEGLKPSQRSIVLLERLLITVLDDLAKTDPRNTKTSVDPTRHGLPPLVCKSLSLLDQQLQRDPQDISNQPLSFALLLETASRCIRNIPADTTLPCLQSLEISIVALMKDGLQRCDISPATSRLHKASKIFSIAVVDQLAHIPVDSFIKLDRLFAGVLESSSGFATTYLVDAWDRTIWQDAEGIYGPRLIQAIERLKDRFEINLPSIPRHHVVRTSSRPGSRCSADHALLTNSHDVDSAESSLSAVFKDDVNSPSGIIAMLPRDPADITPQPSAMRRSKGENSYEHGKSRCDFPNFESSPSEVDELEPQVPYQRQREIRSRQRAEQEVIFADLQSKTSTKNTRSSRAPSSDCEMARKVAASENLPATPTLTRQADANDQEELPSPTPKSRQQTLRIGDIDLPSSPPSVAGAGNVEGKKCDPPYSPSKATNNDDTTMLIFDEELDDDSITMDPWSKSTTDEVTCLMIDDVRPIEPLLTKSKKQPADADRDRTESSQQIPLAASESRDTSELEYRQILPAREMSTDTDDIDVLSASQLSQNLDWHIQEEARTASSPVAQTQDISPASRKRKRTKTMEPAHTDQIQPKRRSLRSGKIAVEIVETGPHIGSSDEVESQGNNKGDSSNAQRLGETQQMSPVIMSTPSSTRRRRGRSKKSKLSPERTDAIDAETPRDPRINSPSCLQVENSLPDQAHATVVREEEHRLPDKTTRPQGNQTTPPNILLTLQSALDSLRHDEQASTIDLKAIDDLCFQIRFQAQEITQKRRQS